MRRVALIRCGRAGTEKQGELPGSGCGSSVRTAERDARSTSIASSKARIGVWRVAIERVERLAGCLSVRAHQPRHTSQWRKHVQAGWLERDLGAQSSHILHGRCPLEAAGTAARITLHTVCVRQPRQLHWRGSRASPPDRMTRPQRCSWLFRGQALPLQLLRPSSDRFAHTVCSGRAPHPAAAGRQPHPPFPNRRQMPIPGRPRLISRAQKCFRLRVPMGHGHV